MSKRSRARRQRNFAWSAMMTWPLHDNLLCRVFSRIAWRRAGLE